MLSKEWFSDKDETTKGEYTLDSPQGSKAKEVKKKDIEIPETRNCANIESQKSNEKVNNYEISYYNFSKSTLYPCDGDYVEKSLMKNMICDQCGKTGMSKIQLGCHKRNVHQKIRLPCPLKNHTKKLHNPNILPPII